LQIATATRQSQTFGFNADLMAGGPRALVVRLPYVHPRSYLAIDADSVGGIFPSAIGKFRVVVFNKLNVGLDVTQTKCNIAVFASFPDPDFDVIRRRVATFEHSGQKFSSGKIGSSESYPTVAKNPVPIVDYAALDVCNIEDVAPARVLGFTDRDSNKTRGDLAGTGGEESTMGFLLTRPVWRGTFTYGDVAPGTVLTTFQLTVAPDTIVHPVDGVFYSTTSMEYAALPFTYWQSNLNILFETVNTKFHAGRLGFATIYGRYTPVGGDLQDLMSQNAVFFDVGGEKSTWEFVIPYKATTDMLRVPWTLIDDGDLRYYSMGIGVLFVVTPLQSNGMVAQQIDVNMYMSASNTKLTMPRPMVNFDVRDEYWSKEREEKMKVELDRELKDYLLAHPRDPRNLEMLVSEEEKE